MFKTLIVTTTLITSAVVGTILIDKIQPEVENTVSYSSIESTLKNALYLHNLGTISPVFVSYNETKSHSDNLIYNDESVKMTIGETCYIGTLINNNTDYNISVC